MSYFNIVSYSSDSKTPVFILDNIAKKVRMEMLVVSRNTDGKFVNGYEPSAEFCEWKGSIYEVELKASDDIEDLIGVGPVRFPFAFVTTGSVVKDGKLIAV